MGTVVHIYGSGTRYEVEFMNAKGSKEDEYSRAAHNVRNADSNPRNNLRRRLQRRLDTINGSQLSIFPTSAFIHITQEERAALAYWKGTPFEIAL